jgi:hypothetical protein
MDLEFRNEQSSEVVCFEKKEGSVHQPRLYSVVLPQIRKNKTSPPCFRLSCAISLLKAKAIWNKVVKSNDLIDNAGRTQMTSI